MVQIDEAYQTIANSNISEILLDYFSSSLVGFVVIVLLINNFMNRSKNSLYSAWLVNLFGVFFHELAHFTVGLLLNAKPVNFSLVPQKMGDNGYVLGHVSFSNTKWYNSFLSAMSPFLLLFVAVWVENNFWHFFDKTLINYIFYLYLLVVFLVNAIPSKQDFKVAFSNIFGVIFWLIILFIIGYIIIIIK